MKLKRIEWEEINTDLYVADVFGYTLAIEFREDRGWVLYQSDDGEELDLEEGLFEDCERTALRLYVEREIFKWVEFEDNDVKKVEISHEMG